MASIKEYLIVFDCDKIHEYVFATGRLREIRGGSMLVRELTERERLKSAIRNMSPNARPVYIGGGAGKIIVPTEDEAKRVAGWLEKNYRERTISGSLTAVYTPIVNNQFKDAVEEGDWLLRRRKNSPDLAFQFAMSPVTKFCESCRRYPTSETMRIEVTERDLCSACSQKWRKNEEVKKLIKSGEYWKEDDFGKAFVEAIRQISPKNEQDWQLAEPVEDLSELAELGAPSNYIGFIHCDGNRMGEHLATLGDEKDFTCFSDLVNKSVYKAAATALAKFYCKPRDKKGKNLIPFDVVLIGGDDLVAITTTDGAIEVANEFCKEFQRLTKEGGHEVSMSAGVVLAHAHQPVVSVHMRAQELLKEAKRFAQKKRKEASEEPLPEISAIDFLVVTTPTLDTLKKVLAVEYRFEESGKKVWRTRRPYTCGEMAKLVHHIKEFKQPPAITPFPRNKLKEIYSNFFEPHTMKEQITFELLLLRTRLSAEHRQLLEEFERDFIGGIGLFWLESEKIWLDGKRVGWCSPLPDLVELYEFIRPA